jgi:hypothetical protein
MRFETLSEYVDEVWDLDDQIGRIVICFHEVFKYVR